MSSILGINIDALAVKKDPWGAAVVSSVGMLGVEEAYLPHTPFMGVPIFMAICAARKGAVVKGD